MSSPSSDEETEAQRVELLRHTAGLTLKVESRRPGSQAGRLPAHCVGSQREEGIVAGPQGGSKFILRYIILFSTKGEKEMKVSLSVRRLEPRFSHLKLSQVQDKK